VSNWIYLAQDRVKWTQWRTFRFHKEARYFLISWVTISFSNNILHSGVSK
jgi:hypothetical protein